MPFYEYVCESCGKDFILLQSMGTQAADTSCPYCNENKVRKIVSKFSSHGGEHSVCSTGGGFSWGGG